MVAGRGDNWCFFFLHLDMGSPLPKNEVLKKCFVYVKKNFAHLPLGVLPRPEDLDGPGEDVGRGHLAPQQPQLSVKNDGGSPYVRWIGKKCFY